MGFVVRLIGSMLKNCLMFILMTKDYKLLGKIPNFFYYKNLNQISYTITYNSMPLLQVISTSPIDSLTIEKSGADRIQLVSALQIGGLTPSSAVIRKSLQCVDIPTMVMVRHHNNGFVHTSEEVELFCEEIKDCLEMGVKGLVFGGITEGKEIDEGMMKRVMKEVNTTKVDVTFHKAFDQVNNVVKAYDQLSELGINRVLTQGGQKPILENTDALKQIIEKSKTAHKTKVLLGGGITFDNIKKILAQTQADQVHIGTCVRKDKYGPVEQSKVEEFLKLLH